MNEHSSIEEFIEFIEENLVNENIETLFEQKFREREVIVFGELFGEKIQKGGELYTDGQGLDFRAFDVVIGNTFLPYETACRVLEGVNLEFLPLIMTGTLLEAVDFVRMNDKSVLNSKAELEGLVGKPVGDFCNRYGNRISDSGIDYILKKYAKIASVKEKTLGSKKVSPHILRRSKATHMLLNGASLPVIQRFLGHKSIQTTEAYLEIGSEAMIKAVEKAGKLIFMNGPQETVSSWKDPDILKRLKEMVK